ncbi:hypothetical protein GCM10027610_105560 [Dactylosporangium cerinum]
MPLDAVAERASTTRVADFVRGGGHTFAADRAVGQALLDAAPHLRAALHAEATVRRHAVLAAVSAGVHVVLDLAAGIADAGTVAGVDARHIPDRVHVVAVDTDPVTVEQLRLVHRGRGNVTVLHGDPHRPQYLLAAAARTVTLHRPVLVLCLGLLQHLTDPAALALLHAVNARLPAGSRLVVSHLVRDEQPAHVTDWLTRLYADTDQPLHLRTRQHVRALLRVAGLSATAVPDAHCADRRTRRDRGLLTVTTVAVCGGDGGGAGTW